MSSQFSPKVSEILAFSREEAARLASSSVGPEHLLLGLMRMKDGPVIDVFHRLRLNMQSVKTELEQKVREDGISQPINTRELVLNEGASNILKLAVLEARIQHMTRVDEQHLLLAILHDQVDNGAKQILEFNNMNYEDVLSLLRSGQTATPTSGIGLPDEEEEEFESEEPGGKDRSGNGSATTQTAQKPKSKTPVLDNFSTDLTRAALDGKLDPVVGREREIQRVVEILGRRKKNNPILIGEPGVGKSAIVEGLAQLIAQRKTSPMFFNKRLVSLDMTGLVAGTKYRGQFEERIRALLKEIEQSPDIIVFIDEIHTIIGAGSAAGTMDAANIMKPALARGTIQCIGATTLDEYRNSIEKDGALERRFQKIIVEPTSVDDTLQILHNIKDRYEHHHHVRYTDDAIMACVKLTERYVADRAFPDKAIDAMDETGSRVHLSHVQIPPEIVEKEKELAHVKDRKQLAVQNQNFELAASYRDRQTQLEQDLASLEAAWQSGNIDDRQEVGDPVSAVSLVQVLRHAVPVSQQRRFQDAGILRGKDLIQLLLRRAPQGKQKPGRGKQPEQTALLPPCHGDPVRVKAVGHPLCFVIRCGVKLSRVPRLRKTGQFPEGCRPAADIRYSVYILRAAVHQQTPVPKLQALPVLLKVLNDELDPGLLFCCAHPLVQSPLLLPRHLRRSHPKHPGCRRRGKQRRSQANTRKATRCGAADRKAKYCGANAPQKQHQKEGGQACARRPQRASLQNDQLSKHDSGRQDLPRPFHSDPVLLILLSVCDKIGILFEKCIQ